MITEEQGKGAIICKSSYKMLLFVLQVRHFK